MPDGESANEPTFFPDAPAAAPEHIGQFRIKRLIASGGMGAVYEAMQEHPRRTVAIKVMKHGVTSKAALHRFEYESQILGRLRHPGVAQVYEAGTFQDGRSETPYFVMEYIPGARPITEYAQEKSLDQHAVLELFAKVCDAVHHGHQRGVIHRDLKPENILVDTTGQPKIIDFGVARATDADIAMTTMRTSAGQLIGTLQYMSPEQIKADPHDIDTRSDVYALGVVLFELLTDSLPYRVTDMPVLEATRVIAEQAPARVSSVDARLRGDVETIVLKALEKDRDRRYQSADEFRGDIEHFLHNEPISARPPSAAYQLRVFARRNKPLVTAAALVFLALTVGTIVATIGMVNANREAKRATAMSEFFKDTLWAVNPLPEVRPPGAPLSELRVSELLRSAEPKIDEKFDDQPELEAEVRAGTGWAYFRLGLFDDAERQMTEALRLREQTLGASVTETLRTHFDLGYLLFNVARFKEAADHFRIAHVGLLRVEGKTDPVSLEAGAMLGSALARQGEYDEALRVLPRVVETQRQVLGASDPKTLSSQNHLANLYVNLDRLEEAERLARSTVDICQRAHGSDHVAALYGGVVLTRALLEQDKLDEAEQQADRNVENYSRVFGAEHPYVDMVRRWVGECASRQNEHGEAARVFESILDRQREHYGDLHQEVCITLEHYGRALLAADRHDDARAAVEPAYQRMEQDREATDPLVVSLREIREAVQKAQ